MMKITVIDEKREKEMLPICPNCDKELWIWLDRNFQCPNCGEMVSSKVFDEWYAQKEQEEIEAGEDPIAGAAGYPQVVCDYAPPGHWEPDDIQDDKE